MGRWQVEGCTAGVCGAPEGVGASVCASVCVCVCVCVREMYLDIDSTQTGSRWMGRCQKKSCAALGL